MASSRRLKQAVPGTIFRSRLLSSASLALLISAVMNQAASSQVVVGAGEYYDGNGKPLVISTVASHALSVSGGTAVLLTQPVNLATTGSGYGVNVVNGGNITLGSVGSDNKITTLATNAHGIFSSASTVNATGLTINSNGGSNAYGVYATSSSTVALTDVSIHTTGSGAFGLHVTTGSTATMKGGNVNAERAYGVWVDGVNSRSFLTDVTITATGNHAVDVSNGGMVTLTGNNVTSFGASAMMLIAGTGTISGSTLLAEKGSNGRGSFGINVNNGGVLHMSNSTVESRADSAQAIWVVSPSVAESTVSDSTIIARGERSHGIVVQGKSWATTERAPRLTISGSTILTYGNSGYGISTQGIETGANAVRVTVSDTVIRTEGEIGIGMAAFEAATITGTNVTVTTQGEYGYGVYTGQKASLTLTGGSLTTFNTGAEGARAVGGTMVLTNVAINTSGDSAIGVRSDNIDGYGTNVTLTGGSVLTKGRSAHGIMIASGGLASVSNTAIETRGANSAGLYFVGTAAHSHDLIVTDSTITNQQGPGVLVRGATNALRLDNSSITADGGTLFDVRRRLVPGSNPAVPDDANPGHLTVVANGGFFKGAARPDDFSTLDFTLNGAKWTITTAAADAIAPVHDMPLTTSRLTSLTLNDSTVSFAAPTGTGDFRTLIVGDLRGNNGLFEMNTDLGAQAGDQMQFGTAEGEHRLLVRNSGAEPGNEGQHLRLVSVNDPATTAGFSLANIGGVVDAGTYRYTLVREDSNGLGGRASDWALHNTSRLSTSGNAAVNTADAGTSQSIWYTEMNTLSKRLGELRLGKDQGGMWARTFAARQKMDNRVGRRFDQTVGGLEFGLDGSIDVSGGRWYLGGMAGYSHADRDFSGNEGRGDTDSYHVGAYATFIADNGWYFDGLVKLNQMKHDYTVRATDTPQVAGNYSNIAGGLSLETGKRFTLADGWFVEPQAELMLYRAGNSSYRSSDGMQIRTDAGSSVQLRTSMMMGKQINLSDNGVIQPYIKLGLIQEFDGRSNVYTNGIRHRSKAAGGRLDMDIGISAKVGERHRLYAEYGYASGRNIRQPWAMNVGYRYTW